MSKSSIIALGLGITSIIGVCAYIAYDTNEQRDIVTLARGATIPPRSPETVSPFGDPAGAPPTQSSTEFEVINGINVPPMPNEAENNKTVAGIDVNANGVRDDVERRVAEAFGDDKAFYDHVMEYNRVLQQGLVSPTKENALVYVKASACFGSAELERYVQSDIHRTVRTTKERGLAFIKLVGFVNNTVNQCSEYK